MKHTNYYFTESPLVDQHTQLLVENYQKLRGAVAERVLLGDSPEALGILVTDASTNLGAHLVLEALVAAKARGEDLRGNNPADLVAIRAFPMAGFRVLLRCLGGPTALAALEDASIDAIPVIVTADTAISFHKLLHDEDQATQDTDLRPPRRNPEPTDALGRLAIKLEYDDVRASETLDPDEEDAAVEKLQSQARAQGIPFAAAFEEGASPLFVKAIIKGYLEGKLGLVADLDDARMPIEQRPKRVSKRRKPQRAKRR